MKGLTTAVTVWCSAGSGFLAAIGQWPELLILTALIVFVNLIFVNAEPINQQEFQGIRRGRKKEG